MIYLRIGNKNGGSPGSRTVLPYERSLNGLPPFFRYVPSDGFLFFWPLTATKTVPRNKKATSWEFWPPQYGIGVSQIFYPEMGAGGVQFNNWFPGQRQRLPEAAKTGKKRPVSVSETRTPFSLTPRGIIRENQTSGSRRSNRVAQPPTKCTLKLEKRCF